MKLDPEVLWRLAAALGALCGLGPVHAAEPAPERIFQATCAYCHGRLLAPGVTVAPELRGRGLSPEMVAVIVRGGTTRMPAFRHTDLGDTELQALGRWLQASARPAPPEAPK